MGQVYTGNELNNDDNKNKNQVINISVAVFFDGTLNNKYNIEYRIDLQRKLAEQTKNLNSAALFFAIYFYILT